MLHTPYTYNIKNKMLVIQTICQTFLQTTVVVSD